jgi:DNA polymerase III alpha subunit (gram-positive type)
MLNIIFGALLILIIFNLFKPSKTKKIAKEIGSSFSLSNSNKFFYFFLDIESTGLLPYVFDFEHRIKSIPNIVQVAWKIFDTEGGFIKGESFIIKQEKEVPERAYSVHGISKEKSITEGVDFNEMAEKLIFDIKKCDVFVAHNARFDFVILQAELLKNNFRFSLKKMKIYCTMLNTSNMCRIKKTTGNSGYKWPKLEELVQKVFIGNCDNKLTIPGVHDAEVDVKLTAKCFFKLQRKEFYFKNNSRKVWEGLNHPQGLEEL